MKTDYRVTIKPLIERQSQIANEVSLSKRQERFYAYRNETKELEVIRIPIHLPVYRVANYRTRLLQKGWIRKRNVPDDFFLTGEENESVQQEQHGFLWELAEEQPPSFASIIEVLESERQQQPILITPSGVVVNGNRRLAAMRELYERDKVANSDFSHVDCMVLPGEATEDDMKDIEVRLQMSPETRLPYDWISELIAVQDLQDRGRDLSEIASLMRIKDKEPEKAIRLMLRVFVEVDLYLRDWKNAEGDYALVKGAEQIFNELALRLMRKEGTELEIARRFGWILVEQRGKEGRIYDYKEVVGTLFPEVKMKIQEVFADEIGAVDPEESDEIIEIDLGGNGTTNEEGIISFLDRCRGNDELQDEIIKNCDLVVETRKQRQGGKAALKAITDANTKLLAVDISTADTSTYSAIEHQLNSIEQVVRILKMQMELLKQRSVLSD